MHFKHVFTLLVVTFSLMIVSISSSFGQSSLLRVHFIDVGQGDSILIQAPATTVLIDGGDDNGDAVAYLQSLGITRLDALIATHPHTDHIGGLIQVMQVFPVGSVWTNDATNTTALFERFLDTIAEHHIPYHEVGTNGMIQVGSLSFDVLYGQSAADDLNDTSLVLHLVDRQVSFLFTGDAEQPAEQALLQTVDPGRLASTVLKVGHHGSYTSSSPAFLAVVHPQIAVYSAGSENLYGHPYPSTLMALEQVGATVYGTDVNGTIVVETDGASYQVDPVRGVGQAQPTPMESPMASTPTLELPYDPQGPDRNCSDFTTQEMAQAFFIAAGGPAHDPDRLDGDHDGIACESLPHAAPGSLSLTATALPFDPNGPDRDCSSFATQAQAQTFFIAAGGPAHDPDRLDGDHDGIACESLP